jgi:hypothetical protein
MKFRHCILTLVLCANVSPTILAQTPESGVLGPLDSGVAAPVSTGILRKVDPLATAELAAHIAATGDVSRWAGFQGTGIMTFGADSRQYQTTLTSSGSEEFRLDVQAAQGTESTRIERFSGKTQYPDGTTVSMPTQSAAVGFFPFSILRTPHFPASITSLHDYGVLSIGSTELHRVAYEFPTVGRNPRIKGPQTAVIDFYFDPATHLLVKSAAQVFIPGARQVPFTSVVTYSDYRLVGGSKIPFHYVESLDGQLYRTLQLSSAVVDPSVNHPFFQF